MFKVSDVVQEIFNITANQKSNEIWEHEFKQQLINTLSPLKQYTTAILLKFYLNATTLKHGSSVE